NARCWSISDWRSRISATRPPSAGSCPAHRPSCPRSRPAGADIGPTAAPTSTAWPPTSTQCCAVGHRSAGDITWRSSAQLGWAKPQPPRQMRPDLPPELDRVGLKGLAKPPGGRYTPAADFADALRRSVGLLSAPLSAALPALPVVPVPNAVLTPPSAAPV